MKDPGMVGGARSSGSLLPRSMLAMLVVLFVTGLGLSACTGSSSDDAVTTATAAATQPSGNTPFSANTSSTESTPAEVDPADWPMLGPTVIDVPAEEVASAVISAQGGVIEYGPVRVRVPAGALAADTTLTITRLGGSFNDQPAGAAAEDVLAVRPLGSIYDFGPAGVSFDEPVTITLPYDPGIGPEGTDPEQIAIAYYNGEYWALAGGTADPQTLTVSVKVQAFEGVSARAVLKMMGPGPWVVGKAIDYEYGPEEEGVDTDPVFAGTAPQWITPPTDPVIQTQAAKAVLYDEVTKTTVALDDPTLAVWVEASVADKHMPVLGYANPDGSVAVGTYDDSRGSNWQKPSAFFTEGTVQGGALHGDCTDHANAAVSIFKAKGIPAKGVYGYADGDSRRTHVWSEVLIGDKVYRVDQDGHLITPETGAYNFKTYQPPTDPSDTHYNSMWDEKGQGPYDPEWWKSNQFAGTYEGTINGLLSGGGESADAEWKLVVDDMGVVTGGWDVTWHEVHDWLELNGTVSKSGDVNASGTEKLTSSSGKTQSGSLTLKGTITGKVFKGTISGSNGSLEVRAELP